MNVKLLKYNWHTRHLCLFPAGVQTPDTTKWSLNWIQPPGETSFLPSEQTCESEGPHLMPCANILTKVLLTLPPSPAYIDGLTLDQTIQSLKVLPGIQSTVACT